MNPIATPLHRALLATRHALRLGDHRSGIAQAELALALAERGDISPTLAEALSLLTHHRFALGRFHDAMASAERARASWQALAVPERACEALCLRAAACSEAGFDEEALHDAHQAFELARAQGLPQRLLQALSLMGGFHSRLGDVAGAEALLLQALSRAGEWQDQAARFLALNNLLGVLVQAHAQHRQRGEHDAARATAQRLLRQAREALTLTAAEPSRLRRAVLRSNAASALMANGRLHEALPLLDDCLAQARSEGFRAVELQARTRLLHCLAQAGQHTDARRAAAELQALLAQDGPRRHQTPVEQEAAAMLAALDAVLATAQDTAQDTATDAVTEVDLDTVIETAADTAPTTSNDPATGPTAPERAALRVLARHHPVPALLQAALQDHLELVLATLDSLDTTAWSWRLRPSPTPHATPAEALPAV